MIVSPRSRLEIGDPISWGRGAWYLLVFLQPFNQFGALRWISLTVLTAALVIVIVKKIHLAEPWYPAIWSVRIGFLLVCWIILTSLIGPYPEESLTAMRQSLIVQIALFLAGFLLVSSAAHAWGLVFASLAGFATLSLFSIGDVISLISVRGLGDRAYSHDSWWGGYGGKGGYYLPLILGWLLTQARGRRARIAGVTLLAVVIVLIALYGARSPLIVGSIGCATFMLFYFERWGAIIVGAFLMTLLLSAIVLSPLGSIFRYNSLLTPSIYVSNEGLSQRLAIWEGMRQVIRDRPLVGYGYGWKKLAWAINERGFSARWKDDKSLPAFFLEGKANASYGRVNPHNYFLQVMFEIGAIGLIMVLVFWVHLVKECVPLLRRGTPEPSRAFAATTIAVLTGYLIGNLTNGHWVGELANLSLSFAGTLLALSIVARQEKGESY